MSGRKALFLTAVLAVSLSAVPASAMNVVITGEACPLQVRSELPAVEAPAEDGTAAEGETAEGETAGTAESEPAADTLHEIKVTEFEVFGYVRDDLIAIRTEEGIVYVSGSELAEKIPEIPVDALPHGENLETIRKGDLGESAQTLQMDLIDLGYLDGKADGNYGNGTAKAVASFQKEHRLDDTGTADIYTQMLIQMEVYGMQDTLETVYPVYRTVEEKFAPILSLTDTDLSAYLDPSWHFDYDVFEQFGTIDSYVPVGSWSKESPEIDRISIDLSLKVVLLANEETGLLEAVPCLVTESRGAYRPYVQGAAFGSGDQVVQIEGGKSTGALDGAELTEFGYIPLTQESAEVLAGDGASVIRLKGRNDSYDIPVDGNRENIARFVSSVNW